MPRHILKTVYVRPSRYDDAGYVVRHWRGVLPSNTLLCLKTLTQSLGDAGELGSDVEVVVEGYDDTVERVPLARLARENRRKDTQVVVGLVGVQSNQFARAADLALELRAAGVPVLIGGFHVSGILALFDTPSRELQVLMDHGVSLVKGEVEAPGVLGGILKDALNKTPRAIYDIREPPCLDDAPAPLATKKDLRRFFDSSNTTVDTSRGCPFDCSFCTIINVQGRKMRSRSAPALLETIQSHQRQGIREFFFTDDNFSRSPIWEELFDGLIALRQNGTAVEFMMQVDSMAYRIPNFVEKAARAGCYLVFVGVESMNAQNLAAAGKKQNKVEDYAAMVAAWHASGVLVYAGYIIGFPHDTAESVARDVEALSAEVKVDQVAFFMFTPLPGSRDHKRMSDACIPLDADLNNYDSCHETFAHSNFAPGAWAQTFHQAWGSFYTKENIVNTLLRAPEGQYWRLFWTFLYFRYCALAGTHPMMTGLFPAKGFRRRPGYPREGLGACLLRRARDLRVGAGYYMKLLFEFEEIALLTRKTPGPQRKALAAIRQQWNAVRQQIAQDRLQDRCTHAAEGIRATLSAASEQLHRLALASRGLETATERAVRDIVREVDNYAARFSATAPSWEQIAQAERFIAASVVRQYENRVLPYVAKRRHFNRFREELLSRLRTRRLLTLDVSMLARALLFESLFTIRVAFVLLKEGIHVSEL